MVDERVPVGLGAGRLSAAAEARVRRGYEEEPPPDWSDHAAVAEWRARVHAAWGEDQPAEAPHRAAVWAGVPVRVTGPEDGPVVVYLHGGAFVLGSALVAAPITARWATTGLRVVSVDYRLAPEHPFPAALDDVRAVCRAIDAPFALTGDSAGGGLAAAVALDLAARGEAGPAALALLSPYVRLRSAMPFAAAYLAGANPDDPRVSPLLGDLRRLPPTLLQVSTTEALFGDAVAFARLARAAGAPVALDAWIGLPHTWHYHRELPEADRALVEAARFVRGALTG